MLSMQILVCQNYRIYHIAKHLIYYLQLIACTLNKSLGPENTLETVMYIFLFIV